MAVFNNFHNEQILKLDVKQQQPNKIPRFVQYDSALLKIELYDNGKLYDVSRANEFVVSAKRPDGSKVSGLAEYDGEFIIYKLSKQDLEILGETEARLQIYEGRNRLSSLSFRYDVYEDFEAVGNPDDVTLLSALLAQVRDALAEAQRQGGYAENRGDFANSAGDYANKAGDSQKMRWLKWVKTVTERNSKYKNPRNGDTVYVVNVADKNGGAVFRYNAVERPAKWEEISGWDTSIIQDIYNMLGDLEDKKETKAKVAQLVKQLQDDLEKTYFGGRNLLVQTEVVPENSNNFQSVGADTTVRQLTSEVGRIIEARRTTNGNYYGVSVNFPYGNEAKTVKGQQYVLSFTGRISSSSNEFDYVYLMRSDGSNQKIHLTRSYSYGEYETISSYKKYEYVFTANSDSNRSYILIGATPKSSTWPAPFWLHVANVKLERGNRATDWSPAFEDLVNNYKELIKEERDRTNGELTKHNSRIKQLEDKITMTVTEKVYNNKMQEIGIWQSEYEQTARHITTTLTKKVGNDEIISRINQSAEEIKIEANKISLVGNVTFEAVKSNAISGKNAYERTNLYESGTRPISPNVMSNWGITSISGGRIQTDQMLAKRIDLERADAYTSSGKRYGLYMQDGISNVNVDIQRNQFMHSGVVSWTGQRYQMSGADMSSNSVYNLETIYTHHSAKYLTVGIGVNLSGTASAYVNLEVSEFSSGEGLGRKSVFVRQTDGIVWVNVTINLGVPDYTSAKSFYIRAGLEQVYNASYLQVVPNRVTMHG